MKKNIVLVFAILIVMFVIVLSCTPEPAILKFGFINYPPSPEWSRTMSASTTEDGTFNKVFTFTMEENATSGSASGTLEAGDYYLKWFASETDCLISDNPFTFEAGNTYETEIDAATSTGTDDLHLLDTTGWWSTCP